MAAYFEELGPQFTDQALPIRLRPQVSSRKLRIGNKRQPAPVPRGGDIADTLLQQLDIGGVQADHDWLIQSKLLDQFGHSGFNAEVASVDALANNMSGGCNGQFDSGNLQFIK